jgi:two-component system, NarL family, invasion response regulator UvrY
MPAERTMKRILIVDDHEVVREGVKKIFSENASSFVFGEAATAPDALRIVREQDWDVVMLDISLGGRSGLELLKELKQIRPRLPVLILSMHPEEQYARRAFKAGAAGYVTKDIDRAELAEAVNRVAEGGNYVTRALAEKLVVHFARGSDRLPHEILSDREFEVMRLITLGKTLNEIAAILSLSDKTISTYRARILEKIGVNSNAELVRYAIQNKLVD